MPLSKICYSSLKRKDRAPIIFLSIYSSSLSMVLVSLISFPMVKGGLEVDGSPNVFS